MKKILIILTLLITTLGTNASTYTPTIDKVEDIVFGFQYNNESDETRLNRLEEKIYGKKSTGNISQRVSKLKKDLSADYIGQEISPKEDTFRTEDDYITYEKEPAEAANIDYPIINELENQVFKKEFKTQNIKTRLTNLEKKTFNKSYENDDLSTRVERLQAKIRPARFNNDGLAQQENSFYTSQPKKMAQNYHLDKYDPMQFGYDSFNSGNTWSDDEYDDYDDLNIPTAPRHKTNKPLNLSLIEKKLYKTKFENEPTSSRLTRIETSIFGTSFQNDSDSERMARISSAIEAQKSARRYDSNKFTQNMATAFQIGTLILMVLACIL